MTKVMIGKIVNTCGLKGEVKTINHSDFIADRYARGKKIRVSNENKGIDEELIVSSYRMKDDFVYLKFEEITDINQAEKYKESIIYVNGEELKKINNDTYYHYELLNMEAYFNETKIGNIIEITNNGVQDLIRVENKDKSFLVPFVYEFIEKIDVENKIIVLKNIEGLL